MAKMEPVIGTGSKLQSNVFKWTKMSRSEYVNISYYYMIEHLKNCHAGTFIESKDHQNNERLQATWDRNS